MNYAEDLKELQPSIACLSLLVDYFLPAHQIQKQFIYSNLKKQLPEKRKFFCCLRLYSIKHLIFNSIQIISFLQYLLSYVSHCSSGNMNDTGGSGNSPPGVLGSPSSGDQSIGAGGSASDGSWMGYLSNVVCQTQITEKEHTFTLQLTFFFQQQALLIWPAAT